MNPSSAHPRYLRQSWAEFWVVLFHAVIEVDFEALLGEGEDDVALPVGEFSEGFFDLGLFLGGGGLVAGAGGLAGEDLIEVLAAVLQLVLELAQVVVE